MEWNVVTSEVFIWWLSYKAFLRHRIHAKVYGMSFIYICSET